jgi:predicted DNA-binding transcriptional regulator YafY
MLIRQWEILRALSANRHGLTISQIEKETEYSRATVYRDLKLLREVGIPMTSETKGGVTRTRLLNQAELPAVGLNALQITAIHLARRELESLAGTDLVAELDALLRRLKPPEAQQTMRFGIQPKSHPRVLKTVEQALRRKKRVHLQYRAASRDGVVSAVHVEPLLLSVADREPYLLAYCVERRAERTYKIARIVTAELTEAPCSYRPSTPPDRAFEQSVKAWTGEPTTVRVKLNAEVAWFAPEYPLVQGQHLQAQADGSVVVEARVAGIVEASRWVLSWGGAAEALDPPELRERTRSELARALANYDKPGPAKARRRKSTGAQKVGSHTW